MVNCSVCCTYFHKINLSAYVKSSSCFTFNGKGNRGNHASELTHATEYRRHVGLGCPAEVGAWSALLELIGSDDVLVAMVTLDGATFRTDAFLSDADQTSILGRLQHRTWVLGCQNKRKMRLVNLTIVHWLETNVLFNFGIYGLEKWQRLNCSIIF